MSSTRQLYEVIKSRRSVHKDDMRVIYDKLQWADAVIIGTPVYQGTLSGQTKAIMDRCRALVAKNPPILKNKGGAPKI